MLKLLLLIDCDHCGCALNEATVCSERDPLLWQETIEVMMFEAAEKGWSFYKKHCRCPQCGYEQDREAEAIQDRRREQDKPKAS
jgi:hypothetical protein